MNKKMTRFMAVSLMVVFAISAVATTIFAEAEMTPAKKTAIDWVDGNEARITKIATAIWNYAELGWQEFKSAKALTDFLTENGFKVEYVPGLATAFVATYGSGKPVIGILGEFDCVAMSSQKPGVPYQDPLVAIGDEVGPGHGCGHNLYGTGSAAAAVAIKQAMDRYGIKGTIKMFGCPSEEILEGKIYMARDGVFDGCDTILTWHPGSSNRISAGSNLAMISVKFSFTGKTAHGARPHTGRSALDAVVLTEVAANFLREHIVDPNRIHGVITKGGMQPNVVPDFAEVWYFVRSQDVTEVKDLLRRLTLCAEAGALASETKMKRKILTGTWDVLPNLRLAQLGWDNLELLGIPTWTPEEVAFAKELQKNMGKPEVGMATTLSARPTAVGGKISSSNDRGDISWIAPSQSYRVAGGIPGTANHSWSATLANSSSMAMKGMLKVAQLLAVIALDLFTHPEILNEVEVEYKERSGGVHYETLLDPDSKPSLDYFAAEMERFGPVLEEYYTSPE